MRRLLAVLAALFVIAAPVVGAGPAVAHGGAFDMKYVDGSNILLLTFNTHAPVSGLDIEHDLRLYDLVGAPIPFDEVAFEVDTRANTNQLTLNKDGVLHEDTAPMLPTNESKLTFAYPAPGSYSLDVTFREGGRDISHGVFALDVAPGSQGASGFPWIRLGLAFLLGLFVASLLRRRAPVVVTEPVVEEAVEEAQPESVGVGARTAP
ncbi:hypothetical protein [Nocardioides currus]|uniref:CopC domain-containing protein n=1 Tax=Nocardioides currus TaxID=2133958 RepID=A0A2R7YV19_9ACTN|nr:hypothetical protein [Nocardioides currus]PUA80215.1 hypothetical protein C7S10_13735 [Nocardioides currus]